METNESCGCHCVTCSQRLKTIHCDDCWDEQWDKQLNAMLEAARAMEDIRMTRSAADVKPSVR